VAFSRIFVNQTHFSFLLSLFQEFSQMNDEISNQISVYIIQLFALFFSFDITLSLDLAFDHGLIQIDQPGSIGIVSNSLQIHSADTIDPRIISFLQSISNIVLENDSISHLYRLEFLALVKILVFNFPKNVYHSLYSHVIIECSHTQNEK
jgi:hypothetical protein